VEIILGGDFLFLRAFDAVLGAAATALFDAYAVERATDDVITHTGKILYAATAHEYNAVLLEVVALVGNIGDDFVAIGQAHFGDFTNGGVGLLGRAGHDLHADAALKRVACQGRGLGFETRGAPGAPDELINGGHGGKWI